MLTKNGQWVLLALALLNHGLFLAMDGELLSGMGTGFDQVPEAPGIQASRSDGRLDQLINVCPIRSGSAVTLLRLTCSQEVDRIYSTGGLDGAHKQIIFLLAARLDGQANLLAAQKQEIDNAKKRIAVLEGRPERTRFGLWARLCCCI